MYIQEKYSVCVYHEQSPGPSSMNCEEQVQYSSTSVCVCVCMQMSVNMCVIETVIWRGLERQSYCLLGNEGKKGEKTLER